MTDDNLFRTLTASRCGWSEDFGSEYVLPSPAATGGGGGSNRVALIFVAIALIALLVPVRAQSPDDLNVAAEYHSRGYLTSIDAKAKTVSFTDSDARHILVNTARARILVPVLGNAPAETGDLVVGMRVQIDGSLAGNTVRAVRVQVLPYVPPSKAFSTTKGVVKPTGIRLQGTILTADSQTGVYTLHVSTHTRTVRVDDLTLYQTADGGDLAEESLREGDLVRVFGTLLPSGVVDAAAMTLIPPTAPPPVNAPPAAPIPPPTTQPYAPTSLPPDVSISITGTVSSRAGLFSRDIKIMVSDQETKISVPHGIPIVRGNEGISVHDLKRDMRVTIRGHYTDPNTFRADQITVIEP